MNRAWTNLTTSMVTIKLLRNLEGVSLREHQRPDASEQLYKPDRNKIVEENHVREDIESKVSPGRGRVVSHSLTQSVEVQKVGFPSSVKLEARKVIQILVSRRPLRQYQRYCSPTVRTRVPPAHTMARPMRIRNKKIIWMFVMRSTVVLLIGVAEALRKSLVSWPVLTTML